MSSETNLLAESILLDDDIPQQLLGTFYKEQQEQTARTRTRSRVYHSRYYRAALRGDQVGVQAHDMGLMDNEYWHCGALYFADEGIKCGGMFTMCCMRGKVHLPPLGEYPELLHHLLTGDSDECADYRQFNRNYTAALLFASFFADGIV
ncbi:hypothetical protein PR048_000377 [Dryococelus australis]|uniref:Uncharacterized protein n=1 Tax=Dryococelus australis TaxID=614101 RepID=A0ABQ9IEF7_9NEOP|nr:hypothetical protein PR048_000377 [Dryococelus australis]